jgi:hypothetical protein
MQFSSIVNPCKESVSYLTIQISMDIRSNARVSKDPSEGKVKLGVVELVLCEINCYVLVLSGCVNSILFLEHV